jgi:tetratricopeptide (TPR) repeat protein
MLRSLAFGLIVASAVMSAAPALAATPSDCDTLRHHGHRVEAQACYQSLTLSSDSYLRAEGFWGLELYQDANNAFRDAVARADGNALYRVRWGRLLHERFNDADAAMLFSEALERDPRNAAAYMGLALVSAEGFDHKAQEYLAKAVQLDPMLLEAHDELAQLALEDSDMPRATREADAALRLSDDALDAMAIHATVEILSDRSPDAWIERFLKINPAYGQGYAIIASHLVINRRYEEGVAYYRKAIDLDPRLWSARSALAINLMRLGQEEEPRRQLELCYNNGYRDPATVNSLRLLDSYKNFVTVRDATTIVKLHMKETEVLRPYVEPLLKLALATYGKKYSTTLKEPVQVEVYPDHEDFAVRTLGMPGLGALGVTFGSVVAMDSPSGRKPGSFNWASTLWHEMDHVFVLELTNHRAPRWFAEGVAVHEEGQGRPEWANRLTPGVVVAMAQKKLLPIAELDRGFVHPEYPEQVIVSYFQAGRIFDYIQDRWGAPAIVDMVHRFGALESTPDVIRHTLGLEPEAFDTQFQGWLDKEAGPIVTQFDEWRKRLKSLAEMVTNGQNDAALAEGETLRHLYPEYVDDASPYIFLGQIYAAKGDRNAAIAALTDYKKFGGENPEALKKLASLQEEAGHPQDAAATLDAVNDIYPLDEDLHRRLGDLWLAEHNEAGAIREYTALVALHPLDKAGALYKLAAAYFAARQFDKAEAQVLAALEAAPNYRPAQNLLLQIEDATPRRPQ